MSDQCPRSLTGERIASSGWIERARDLAEQSGQSIAPPRSLEAAGASQQHYASFFVKLLMEADQRVRGTTIQYLKGAQVVIDYITRQAELNLAPLAEPAPALAEGEQVASP